MAAEIAANAGGRQCSLLRWGLIPGWSEGINPQYVTNNARSETCTRAGPFRSSWK
ncbi:MAG: SOS response-associated peptidase family protein [Rhodospirillaceae bacterium]